MPIKVNSSSCGPPDGLPVSAICVDQIGEHYIQTADGPVNIPASIAKVIDATVPLCSQSQALAQTDPISGTLFTVDVDAMYRINLYATTAGPASAGASLSVEVDWF